MKNSKQLNLKLTAGAMITGLAMMSSGTQAYDIVHNDNGLKMKLKGDYELQLRQRVQEDRNLDLEYDDLEIKFHAEQTLGSGMKIFGVLEADFKGEGDGGAAKNLDAGYVGLDLGNFEIAFGKYDYATDNFSVEADYEMGPGDGFDQFNDAGSDLIFGNYKAGGFKLYFSTDIAEGKDGEVKDESSVDLVAQFKISGLNFAVGYQDFKEDGEAESIDTIGARVKTKIGGLGLGLAYTTNDTSDQIDASFKYKLGNKLSGASGFSRVSPDGGEDINYWYSNVTRSFTKNTRIFAEIGGDNRDNTKTGYLAGLRVRF